MRPLISDTSLSRFKATGILGPYVIDPPGKKCHNRQMILENRHIAQCLFSAAENEGES